MTRAEKEYLELVENFEHTKDKPLEGMAQFFDKRVETYEDHMIYVKDYYTWMAELIPEGTKTLLDIGCGTGLELDRIFERFPDMCVTGVDLSTKMLDGLRRKHSGRSLTIIQDDYFVHEYTENSFDAAVAFETLHHVTMEKKAQAYRQIYRALKPGGVFIECEYVSTSEKMEELFFSECARRRKRDDIPDDVFVHFDTPLTIEHEIEAIKLGGFNDVEYLCREKERNGTAMIRAIKEA